MEGEFGERSSVDNKGLCLCRGVAAAVLITRDHESRGSVLDGKPPGGVFSRAKAGLPSGQCSTRIWPQRINDIPQAVRLSTRRNISVTAHTKRLRNNIARPVRS